MADKPYSLNDGNPLTGEDGGRRIDQLAEFYGTRDTAKIWAELSKVDQITSRDGIVQFGPDGQKIRRLSPRKFINRWLDVGRDIGDFSFTTGLFHSGAVLLVNAANETYAMAPVTARGVIAWFRDIARKGARRGDVAGADVAEMFNAMADGLEARCEDVAAGRHHELLAEEFGGGRA